MNNGRAQRRSFTRLVSAVHSLVGRGCPRSTTIRRGCIVLWDAAAPTARGNLDASAVHVGVGACRIDGALARWLVWANPDTNAS